MSYLVIARKFRPQTFASIIGQEHISHALSHAIARNRVPHAILLTGPRGVGKTTTARVFAKALNCQKRPEVEELSKLSELEANTKVEPCGECANCQEIARSASLAVWEIDGASNNSVDNVRELIESLRSLPPPGCRYKIYIIDEVHMLSVSAFNALLKSLEEPPPNTVFIFATTEAHKIPETVLSRCQRYDFRRLSSEVISAHLREIVQQEGVNVDLAAINLIARKANGGMRDAQTMLDRLLGFSLEKIDLATAQQLLGVFDREIFFRIAHAIVQRDPQSCFTILAEAFDRVLDLRSFAGDFLQFWRDLLLISLSSQRRDDAELASRLGLEGSEIHSFATIAEQLPSFDIHRLFDLAAQTVDTALNSAYPRFVFEAGVAKMAVLPSLKPIGEILRGLEGGGVSHAPVTPSVMSAKEVATTPKFEWGEFVSYVLGQSQALLGALLKRVSARHFSAGSLELVGTPFDVSSIQDPTMLQRLKDCLVGYSKHSLWNIKFAELADKKSGVSSNPAAERGDVTRPPAKESVPEDSLLAQEKRAEKDRVSEVDRQARNSPAVQAALKTFEGSKIDRVSILKE